MGWGGDLWVGENTGYLESIGFTTGSDSLSQRLRLVAKDKESDSKLKENLRRPFIHSTLVY